MNSTNIRKVSHKKCGDIAQLARAPALQAGGPGFESLCLHQVFEDIDPLLRECH